MIYIACFNCYTSVLIGYMSGSVGSVVAEVIFSCDCIFDMTCSF